MSDKATAGVSSHTAGSLCDRKCHLVYGVFFKESYWQLEDLKAILIGLHWPQELLASDSEGTGEGKLA